MAISYKVDNVEISALRDRIMFNSFAGNKSYVCKGYGDELAVTTSSSSFEVTLGSGEAVICGGSTFCTGGDTLTLEANQNGYLVLRVDITQTSENVCKFMNVPELIQGNINNGDEVFDLPLYSYITNTSGVSSKTDVRQIEESLFGRFKVMPNNTDFNDLKPSGAYEIGYYVEDVSSNTNVNQPLVYTFAKKWHVISITSISTERCYQVALSQSTTKTDIYFRNCYNGTWTMWSEFLSPVVANDYDIETLGNYVQYQTSYYTSNSFTSASGIRLYFLLSYSNGNQAYQIAIGTNNTLWFRYYQWWETTGWQSWKNAMNEEIGVYNNDSDRRDYIGVQDGVGTFVASTLTKNSINTDQGFQAIKLTSPLSTSAIPNDLEITSSFRAPGAPQTTYGTKADIKRAYCRNEVVDWSASSFYRTYPGYLSTNRKTLNLSIILPRGISDNVTSVTFQNMTLSVINASGTIIANHNIVESSTYNHSVQIDKNSDVMLVSITKKDDTIFDYPSLSAVNVLFYKAKFTFA